MPSNFEIAALDAEKTASVEERVAEITVNKKYVSLWRRPSPGQYAMFQLRLSRSAGTEQARGLDRFFGKLILTPEEITADGRVNDEGVAYADLAEEGEIVPVGLEWFIELIETDLVQEEFLVDLLREAMEIHSGFPTQPEPGSSPSPKTSGRRSTAGSRRVASTPSA